MINQTEFDPLMDGISSVQLYDNMGTDLTVVNAARVSMAKESDWVADPLCADDGPFLTLGPKDVSLVKYLAKHKHWTPFSHPQITLRIKMPIFIARQWFKHMVGFTRNEVSRRYVDDTPEFYTPTEWRKRAENVKQGSSDEVVAQYNEWRTPEDMAKLNAELSLRIYQNFLDVDICPEQARMVLPQSMYTEFIETGSLAAYARLAALRLDPHAQKEVRMYAECIDQLMGTLYPVSWEALREGR